MGIYADSTTLYFTTDIQRLPIALASVYVVVGHYSLKVIVALGKVERIRR